jgi:hypothetical protein
MNNTKYNKLESILSEMDVLSRKVVDLLNESDCCGCEESKPYAETTYLHTYATPEQLSKLDIQPGDKVRIESYCGFLPAFARDFTYDEASMYEVVKVGFSRYNMPVYILADCNNNTSVVPYCYLKIAIKASEPMFVLDNTSDPQGIIIKNNITGKAVVHINKNTAINSKIDPVTFSSTLCAFLNNAVSQKETSGSLEV